MADEVAEVVDEVVARVKRRLDSLEAGKNDPCSTGPGKTAANSDAECAESCFVCPNHDTCGTVMAVKGGAARITPDRVRTSVDIAPYIDHTLLNPQATKAEISKLCDEAKEHKFFAVCVNPHYVRQAVKELSSSEVAVATVIGFPLGANLTDIKIAEAQKAVSEGAEFHVRWAQIGGYLPRTAAQLQAAPRDRQVRPTTRRCDA